MFLRDFWYAAGLSRDIGRTPLARRIIGEDLVLYRTESGSAVALRDRCPHRSAPLSMGELVGDEIQCRYHGFRFDGKGACVAIPGENFIPPAICVETFPVVERHQLAWVWMGAKDAADPSSIPEWPWLGDAAYVHFHLDNGVFHAPLPAIVDNLLDLTHVHFTHRLLGADNLVHDSEPMETIRRPDGVHFSRKLRKAARLPPDTYMEIGGAFLPPSICLTSSLLRDSDTDEPVPGPATYVLHCLSPETAETTRYYAIRSWNLLTRPEQIAALEHQVKVTVEEDRDMLEAQHRVRQAHPDVPERLIRADAAAVDARRLYGELLEREQTGRAAA